MVPAARTVGVEVLALDAVLDEVLPGRAVLPDGAGGRDVVGRDAVADHDQTARAGDVLDGARLLRHPVEVRRLAHVGRVGIPGEDVALGHVQRGPVLVPGEHVRVGSLVHLHGERASDRLLHLLGARPEVAEEDVVAVLVLPDRLGGQVDVDPPGERVGDDERRRGEVVRLHLGVDARLEVAVPGEDGADDEVALLDRLRDLGRERPGVADARRAAVADGVEAELLEEGRQAGLVVVLGDDLGAGREARLHPRLPADAALDGVLRQEAGRDHHRRVRRVRAARDRRDDDGAVLEVERLVAHGDRDGSLLRLGERDRNRLGMLLLLGLAERLVPRRPGRRRVARGERVGDLLVRRAVAVRDAEGRERLEEGRLRLGQRHAVLRAPRPGEARLDVAEVEVDHLRVLGRVVGVVEEALDAAVRLHQLDLLRAPAR